MCARSSVLGSVRQANDNESTLSLSLFVLKCQKRFHQVTNAQILQVLEVTVSLVDGHEQGARKISE